MREKLEITCPDSIPLRYQVNPFDFFSDLLCAFSDQMIHLVIMLDGQMNYDALVRAALRATEAEPVTRCRLIQENDMLWWDTIPLVTAADLITEFSVPDPASHLQNALSYCIDPFRGPMVKIVYIRSTEKNGDVLVINAHHASMDGKGMKDFAGLLLSQYRADWSGASVQIEPTNMSTRVLPRLSSLAPDLLNKADVQIRWSDKFSVPSRSLICERQVFSLLSLNKERVGRIHATRKEWGVTLNDLMLAVVATACSRATSGKINDIHLLNTIDLRRYLTEVPQRSVFNFATAFEVAIEVDPDDTLRDTAIRTHQVMNQIKKGTPGIDAAIEAECLYDAGCTAARCEMERQWNGVLAEGKRSPLFTNTGIIYPEQLDSGVPVSHAFLLPTHNLPPGFSFAISTFGDEMTLSSSYGLPAFDPDFVRTLYSSIDMILPGHEDHPGAYSVI
nr:hypothetical protein [uncultured Methanospirillum sp.]